MTTRSETRTLSESFDFVFDDILEQPPDGHLRLCCQEIGVLALPDLLELTKEDMSDWSGTSIQPGEVYPVTLKFRVLDIKKILHLQAWYVSHDDADAALWNTINKKDYLEWFNRDQVNRVRASLGTTENVFPPSGDKAEGNPGLTNPTSTVIANFQRSIKLNLNDYSKFKEDKYWHKWLDQITSIAAIHQTSDVLDPMFVPKPGDETDSSTDTTPSCIRCSWNASIHQKGNCASVHIISTRTRNLLLPT